MKDKGLLTLSILLALSLVLILSVHAENSTGTNGNSNGNNQTNNTCVDTDGGKKYYINGSTIEGGEAIAVDNCVNSTTLLENYCDGNLSKFEQYTCPNGCQNGACINQTIGGNNTCTEDDDCNSGYECENGKCILEDEDENETDDDECEWRCSKWTMCANGTQTRTCSILMNCTGEEPKLEKRCVGFNFSKEKVCCKITESETENNQTKNKTEYKWEDRASCLETDEDEEGETKEIVAKSYCMEEIREECEYDTIRERAKCRYQNRNRFENFSEFKSDSCEGLRNKGLCIALYVRSQNCFEKIGGEERDRCFKQIAEFAQHQLNKEVNESTNKTEGKEKVRRYMVLVLENLQQRVERAVIKSRLTAEQGAALTEKIIEIKQSILDGAGKEEIRSQLKELKELWKSYKVGEEENE